MPDEIVMPFGKYKGQPMNRIPAGYLVYIYDTFDWLRGKPKEYIAEHIDQLRKDAEAYRLRKDDQTRN